MSQWASRACSTESKMNRQFKFPLAMTATALALILGPLSSQADEVESGQHAAADAAKPHAADTAERSADAEPAADDANTKSDIAASNEVDERSESDHASAPASADTDGDVAAIDSAVADTSVARSKSFTKTIETPHMTKSISHSKSMAKDEDGDMAMAKAMARAKALDTPGVTRTDTTSKTTVTVEGDAEADAAAVADATIDQSGMSVETFAETSVAVE
jgi:hypothetical protein